eukprot:43828-Amorphochlora_amoeboformis.AAC.1
MKLIICKLSGHSQTGPRAGTPAGVVRNPVVIVAPDRTCPGPAEKFLRLGDVKACGEQGSPGGSDRRSGNFRAYIPSHCNENKGESVSGQLLGLNVEGKLEVTNSFPGLPAEEKTDPDAFLDAMMKLLKQVNVDNNSVGWYQSAYGGEWIENDIIRTQYNFQSSIPESVVLVYDPYTTTKGNLAVKTYRLNPDFMKFYKTKDFSHIKMSGEEGIEGFLYFVPVPQFREASNRLKRYF